MTLEELLAKQEIYELCCTYMRSLDRLDGQLRQSVFHDDASRFGTAFNAFPCEVGVGDIVM